MTSSEWMRPVKLFSYLFRLFRQMFLRKVWFQLQEYNTRDTKTWDQSFSAIKIVHETCDPIKKSKIFNFKCILPLNSCTIPGLQRPARIYCIQENTLFWDNIVSSWCMLFWFVWTSKNVNIVFIFLKKKSQRIGS